MTSKHAFNRVLVAVLLLLGISTIASAAGNSSSLKKRVTFDQYYDDLVERTRTKGGLSVEQLARHSHLLADAHKLEFGPGAAIDRKSLRVAFESMRNDMRAAFLYWDIDADGSLSVTEAALASELIAVRFNAADKNKDLKLSYREFINSGLLPRWQKRPALPRKLGAPNPTEAWQDWVQKANPENDLLPGLTVGESSLQFNSKSSGDCPPDRECFEVIGDDSWEGEIWEWVYVDGSIYISIIIIVDLDTIANAATKDVAKQKIDRILAICKRSDESCEEYGTRLIGQCMIEFGTSSTGFAACRAAVNLMAQNCGETGGSGIPQC